MAGRTDRAIQAVPRRVAGLAARWSDFAVWANRGGLFPEVLAFCARPCDDECSPFLPLSGGLTVPDVLVRRSRSHVPRRRPVATVSQQTALMVPFEGESELSGTFDPVLFT